MGWENDKMGSAARPATVQACRDAVIGTLLLCWCDVCYAKAAAAAAVGLGEDLISSTATARIDCVICQDMYLLSLYAVSAACSRAL
jgi:hypothetical protein